MRSLAMALRSLAREWRRGDLFVLLLSLTVAVAALSGVGFLVDRIGRAVESQAAEVLAADLRLESPQPIPAEASTVAREAGLQVAVRDSLISVIYRGDASQLTDVKAVSAGYPLRGRLTVSGEPFGAPQPTRSVPAPGEAWPDSRLAAALGAHIGSTLSVGRRELRVGRILISRPDQGATFVEFAATLLINSEDLASTGLVQPGSRVEHGLLLAGEPDGLRRFEDWYRAQPANGSHLAGVSEGSPQIGRASERAGRFLALASLVAVMLCAVSVAMSARSYVRRHLDAVALMKTLGATRGFVLRVSLFQLLALALIAGILGAALGWLTQEWLVHVLRGWLKSDLPPPGWTPAITGLLIAVAMLAGFALPSLLQLTRVPALRVLRRDAGPPGLRLWLAALPAFVALAVVTWATLRERWLAIGFGIAMLGAVAALAIGGWALVRMSGRVRGSAGIAWRYGLANLARRRSESVVQIVAFGLGMLLLLMLAILRRDLVSDWQKLLPAHPPNYFFVNIPANQRDAFRSDLEAAGARLERMLPQVRGRLVSINGKAPRPGSRFVEGREQNLTWSTELGDDNRIVAGQWWTAADAGKPLVSLATEFQEDLGLKLGDTLRFDVAGETLDVTVASFRAVKWDSFRPNFFIVFPPGLLDGAAGTYMTSAEFEPRSAGTMATLVQRYPTVSIFNIGDLLAQVRAVIGKAVAAVQSVFLFTLLAGLTVLFAAVQSSRDERALETAVLRTLGAERRTLRGSMLSEFASLGAVAGLLAASGATLGGFLFARQLDLKYHFDWLVWCIGVAVTIAITAGGGWLATRRLIAQPPRVVLR